MWRWHHPNVMAPALVEEFLELATKFLLPIYTTGSESKWILALYMQRHVLHLRDLPSGSSTNPLGGNCSRRQGGRIMPPWPWSCRLFKIWTAWLFGWYKFCSLKNSLGFVWETLNHRLRGVVIHELSSCIQVSGGFTLFLLTLILYLLLKFVHHFNLWSCDGSCLISCDFRCLQGMNFDTRHAIDNTLSGNSFAPMEHLLNALERGYKMFESYLPSSKLQFALTSSA